MNKKLLATSLSMLLCIASYAADPKLTGTVMGCTPSVDYDTNGYPSSTTVNIPADAFDGNLNTYYASYQRSNTWVGLDLGKAYIITKVGWSPRNDGNGPGRMKLGRFEGANNADFSDAFPLYIISEPGIIGEISYANVNVSKGFRYVRYCGPGDARCNIAEAEFYGHIGTGNVYNMNIAGGLPMVYINTTSGTDPYDKEHELESIVTIIDKDGNVLCDTASVRLRGNASKDFPKKPYRIKFNSKHHVLGSPAKAKKWTLINNYGDKTLMRNMLAFRTSQLMGMPYTPFCTPVNVIVNGDYKGCYQLCDQIEIAKNRIAIDKLSTQDNSGTNLQGGYLIEIDAYASNEPVGQWFTSNHNNPVTLKEPDDSITNAQRNYITGVFNTMENAVYSQNNWRQYLDEETFLKHFLVGELSGNMDTYWSVYMYKKRDDAKLFTGPVWDFDLAYENDQRIYPVSQYSNYVYNHGSSAGNMKSFVTYIVTYDTQAQQELTRWWSIARDHGLTETALLQYVDSVANALEDAQTLNFVRWPILSTRVHQNPRAAGSYQGEINYVKTYLSQRITWMDSHVGYRPGVYNTLPETQEGEDGTIRIWNIQGLLIFEGEEMPRLNPGMYIIQKGNTTEKYIIR